VGIGIEAKADEMFGAPVGEMIAKKRASKDPTRMPERADALIKALFGMHASADESPWADLRYQLVTGAAGTLIQAAQDSASVALFVVHEFHNHTTQAERLAQNLADYRRFLDLLFPGAADTTHGKLVGPATLPADAKYTGIRLLVGRIVTKSP
jgi:hypothetical protein